MGKSQDIPQVTVVRNDKRSLGTAASIMAFSFQCISGSSGSAVPFDLWMHSSDNEALKVLVLEDLA